MMEKKFVQYLKANHSYLLALLWQDFENVLRGD